MNNNQEFESTSNVAGLLHDYGRFMQAVLFNNYKDAEDFFKEHGLSGHGEVGARILFINDEINQSIRLEKLNKIAISQMKILNESDNKEKERNLIAN